MPEKHIVFHINPLSHRIILRSELSQDPMVAVIVEMKAH